MNIYIYKGEWNLASIDFECLRTLAYIRLTKAPVKVITGGSTFWSPNGRMPYLTTEDGNKYAGYKNIIGYLKSLDFTLPDPTNNLSDDSHVELLRQNLHPYYMYSQWCQASQDYSRALYAVRIRFPYNFITPRDYFERTDDLMQTYYKFSLEDPVNSHDIAQMALKAKQTLNMLELKLSKSKWAGGSTPSILDAHVYAYIALIAKNNLPYNSLQVHVKQCPNLLRYVEDFTQAYLSKDGYSSEQKSSSDEKRKEEEPKSTFSTGQDEEDNPKDIRKRYLLSALVATISMLTYSIMKGIVSISYEDDQMDYIDHVLADEGVGEEEHEDA